MEFCFASWFTVLKEHGIKKECSNEKLMRDLFTVIRLEAGVKTKSGEDWVAKETVSAIVNRKESLPKGIKRSISFLDFDKLYFALKPFYGSHFRKSELVLAAEGILKSYISSKPSEEGTDAKFRLNKSDPERVITMLLVESAKIENKLFGIKRNLYSNGNNAINYIFGDIIAMSLSSKKAGKRAIYVIPVDADYHFHVTKSGEIPACVSPNTIHGKWIKRLESLGVDEQKITEAVGGRINGCIGDIKTFEFKGSLFYLLACSKFDGNNVAHSTKEDIKLAIKNLLTYHDAYGQGDELYLPLIGTGSSRAKLGLKQSFDLIRGTIMENEQWHNGHINIVLHISAIEKMEEFENVLQN